jgi:hypothetical protein
LALYAPLHTAMHFAVGDIIHHGATKEQGRIVRFFKSDKRVGYIVTTIANGSSTTEIEALWFPREIKEIEERARRGPDIGGLPEKRQLAVEPNPTADDALEERPLAGSFTIIAS